MQSVESGIPETGKPEPLEVISIDGNEKPTEDHVHRNSLDISVDELGNDSEPVLADPSTDSINNCQQLIPIPEKSSLTCSLDLDKKAKTCNKQNKRKRFKKVNHKKNLSMLTDPLLIDTDSQEDVTCLSSSGTETLSSDDEIEITNEIEIGSVHLSSYKSTKCVGQPVEKNMNPSSSGQSVSKLPEPDVLNTECFDSQSTMKSPKSCHNSVSNQDEMQHQVQGEMQQVQDEMQHQVLGEMQQVQDEMQHQVHGEMQHVQGEMQHQVQDEMQHQAQGEMQHDVQNEVQHQVHSPIQECQDKQMLTMKSSMPMLRYILQKPCTSFPAATLRPLFPKPPVTFPDDSDIPRIILPQNQKEDQQNGNQKSVRGNSRKNRGNGHSNNNGLSNRSQSMSEIITNTNNLISAESSPSSSKAVIRLDASGMRLDDHG